MGCTQTKRKPKTELVSRVLDTELEQFIENKIAIEMDNKCKKKLLRQLELFECQTEGTGSVLLYPKDYHSLVMTPFMAVDEYICLAVACVLHLHKTLKPALFVKRFIHVTKLRALIHKLSLLDKLGLLSDLKDIVKEQLLSSWVQEEWKNYKLLVFTDNYPGCRITRPEIQKLSRLKNPEKVFVPLNYIPEQTDRPIDSVLLKEAFSSFP